MQKKSIRDVDYTWGDKEFGVPECEIKFEKKNRLTMY